MSIRIGRRGALKGLAAGAAALAAPGLFGGCAPSVVRGRGARRPNIVFIMTDDHAQSALGVYGNHILKTPNRVSCFGLAAASDSPSVSHALVSAGSSTASTQSLDAAWIAVLVSA